jgi:hypothetical protein
MMILIPMNGIERGLANRRFQQSTTGRGIVETNYGEQRIHATPFRGKFANLKKKNLYQYKGVQGNKGPPMYCLFSHAPDQELAPALSRNTNPATW